MKLVVITSVLNVLNLETMRKFQMTRKSHANQIRRRRRMEILPRVRMLTYHL